MRAELVCFKTKAYTGFLLLARVNDSAFVLYFSLNRPSSILALAFRSHVMVVFSYLSMDKAVAVVANESAFA